jgi:hypothetical protein
LLVGRLEKRQSDAEHQAQAGRDRVDAVDDCGIGEFGQARPRGNDECVRVSD